jgi:hypothetical protein
MVGYEGESSRSSTLYLAAIEKKAGSGRQPVLYEAFHSLISSFHFPAGYARGMPCNAPIGLFRHTPIVYACDRF